MRVETSHHQNNRNSQYQQNKKKNVAKENERQNHTESSESFLELSEESLLLYKLIQSRNNAFKPIPFYFTNAPARNVQQACKISKNVQREASDMGYQFDYSMIYDMVVDTATQRNFNKIHWHAMSGNAHEILSQNEKELFEELHAICVNDDTPTAILDRAVNKLIEEKQNAGSEFTNKHSARIIVEQLKQSPIQHTSTKTKLNERISIFVSKDEKKQAV